MIKIVVNAGEEVIKKVTNVIKEKGIESGSITLIGGVESCCISNMDKNDAKKDILTETGLFMCMLFHLNERQIRSSW
jgi:uncharacterized protein